MRAAITNKMSHAPSNRLTPSRVLAMPEYQAQRECCALAAGSVIRVYHVEGLTQYLGTCKFHIYTDCRHLTRPRTMGPMNMTGLSVEDTLDPNDHRICKHCRRRQASSLNRL